MNLEDFNKLTEKVEQLESENSKLNGTIKQKEIEVQKLSTSFQEANGKLEQLSYDDAITKVVDGLKLAGNNLAIEINCTATYNGKEGYANNGSTIHDNSKIIRINGVYNYNGNRNVHDVGDSKSWNLGCEASYGVQLDQYNFALGIGVETDYSKMWLDTCISKGNNFGTGPYQSASPMIYAYDYIDNCTQISTYTPIAYDYKL